MSRTASRLRRASIQNRRRASIEDQHQRMIAGWLDSKPWLLWCHVPNGGARDIVTGARLKRMGVKPGVPDILIFTPSPIWGRPTAVELKRPDGVPSDVSDEQKAWLESLNRIGWRTAVAYGYDAAVKLFVELGYHRPPTGRSKEVACPA